MGFFKISSLFAPVLLLSSSYAQLTGVLKFDGINTLAVAINNPTAKNYSILATNTLFDREHQIPYAPVSVVTANGTAVTLNGTEYPPSPTGLSDIEFQSVPPGSQYTRNLLLSNYLPIVTAGVLPFASTQYTASLPAQVLAVDTTGISDYDTLATYYLSRGLRPVTITSVPLTFNWTFPGALTTGRARIRRRMAFGQPPPPVVQDIPI